MIVIDTSVWIEFFRASPSYFEKVSGLMQQGRVIGVPWVFGELIQGARNEEEIEVLSQLWRSIPKPESIVLENAWILAGIESFRGKWLNKGVGLIDAAIYAVALELECKVWTLDKKLSQAIKFRKVLYAE